MDDDKESKKLLRELGLSYIILPDPTGNIVRKYGVYNLLGDGVAAPSVFVISRNQLVSWKYIGESVSDRPNNQTILSEIKMLTGR